MLMNKHGAWTWLGHIYFCLKATKYKTLLSWVKEDDKASSGVQMKIELTFYPSQPCKRDEFYNKQRRKFVSKLLWTGTWVSFSWVSVDKKQAFFILFTIPPLCFELLCRIWAHHITFHNPWCKSTVTKMLLP